MIQNSGLEDGRVTSLKTYAKKQIDEILIYSTSLDSFLRESREFYQGHLCRVNGKRPSTKQWQDNNQKLDDEQ